MTCGWSAHLWLAREEAWCNLSSGTASCLGSIYVWKEGQCNLCLWWNTCRIIQYTYMPHTTAVRTRLVQLTGHTSGQRRHPPATNMWLLFTSLYHFYRFEAVSVVRVCAALQAHVTALSSRMCLPMKLPYRFNFWLARVSSAGHATRLL